MCFVDFIWNAHLSHTKHIVCERNFSKQRKYKTNIRVSSQNHQAKSKQKINIKCHYAVTALKRNKYRRKPFELCLFCAKQFHVGICQNSFEVFLFVFFAILAIRHRMCGACVCRSISCLMLSRARNTSHTHTHTKHMNCELPPNHFICPCRGSNLFYSFFFIYQSTSDHAEYLYFITDIDYHIDKLQLANCSSRDRFSMIETIPYKCFG